MPRTTHEVWEGESPTPSSGGNYGYIPSVPPTSMFPITNVYWNPILGMLVGEYDDAGNASAQLQSTPPAGCFVITNLYWNPSEGKLTTEYEDEQ